MAGRMKSSNEDNEDEQTVKTYQDQNLEKIKLYKFARKTYFFDKFSLYPSTKLIQLKEKAGFNMQQFIEGNENH